MTSMTPSLAIAKCYADYVGFRVRCLFKSDSTIFMERTCFITNLNLESYDPVFEKPCSPITSADAHAGLVYTTAIFKAYTRYGKHNNRFYIKFGHFQKKPVENEIVRISGNPIYYVLHDVLKRSGFRLVRIETIGNNQDLVYCLIEKAL